MCQDQAYHLSHHNQFPRHPSSEVERRVCGLGVRVLRHLSWVSGVGQRLVHLDVDVAISDVVLNLVVDASDNLRGVSNRLEGLVLLATVCLHNALELQHHLKLLVCWDFHGRSPSAHHILG